MKRIGLYYSTGHEAHFENGHPERPERLEVIKAAFQDCGIWDSCAVLEPYPPPFKLLASVHTSAYLDQLQNSCASATRLDMDTYTTAASWQLALNAAGGAVAAAEAVWTGEADRALALTRPPGHHATPGRGMGFCLLNNIAIAAQHLLHPAHPGFKPARRLAIVDLDLHHGNGTQDVFLRRQDVFYLSTHQSPLYPGSGYIDEIGEGDGEGFTANFPLPPGTGDTGFNTVMDELILPLLDDYAPEMVLVSVGFDTHWRDPLGSLLLSAGGYFQLIDKLVQWCDRNCQGKIALILEGGYDLQAGEACAIAWWDALAGVPFSDSLGVSSNVERSQWNVVVRAAHQVWDGRRRF